jgi:hypothetical protein
MFCIFNGAAHFAPHCVRNLFYERSAALVRAILLGRVSQPEGLGLFSVRPSGKQNVQTAGDLLSPMRPRLGGSLTLPKFFTGKRLALLRKITKTTSMPRFVSLLCAGLMSYAPSLLACELCKEPSSVAGDSGVAGISASFSWSVIFMLGMLAFLTGGMVFMMVRSCKRLAEQQQQTVPDMQRSSVSSQRPSFGRGGPGFGVPDRSGFEGRSPTI